MQIKEILFTEHEAFTLFSDGTISRHRGRFEIDPDGRYIHNVYAYPSAPTPEDSKTRNMEEAKMNWHRECHNIDEMNDLAKQSQRKAYLKKVALIRKQWKAQQPSLWGWLLARVRS